MYSPHRINNNIQRYDFIHCEISFKMLLPLNFFFLVYVLFFYFAHLVCDQNSEICFYKSQYTFAYKYGLLVFHPLIAFIDFNLKIQYWIEYIYISYRMYFSDDHIILFSFGMKKKQSFLHLFVGAFHHNVSCLMCLFYLYFGFLCNSFVNTFLAKFNRCTFGIFIGMKSIFLLNLGFFDRSSMCFLSHVVEADFSYIFLLIALVNISIVFTSFDVSLWILINAIDSP